MNSASTPRHDPSVAFVTGATGFVGSFLIDRLLQEGRAVVALARGPRAADRVRSSLAAAGRAVPIPIGRLRVIEGDVRDPNLGLTETGLDALADTVREIWHCAANFGSTANGESPHSVNFGGTRNVLGLATRCNLLRATPYFQVSTAFAGDVHNGRSAELPPSPDIPGRNAYENSKREAERLVLGWIGEFGFPGAIFRPSIIVGDAETGRAAGFAAYYDFLRGLCVLARSLRNTRAGDSRPLRIAADPAVRVNLVTIDFVISAMMRLAQADRGRQSIFNVVHDLPVSVGAIVDEMLVATGLTGSVVCAPEVGRAADMNRLERAFHSLVQFEQPYLMREVLFDSTHFRSLLPARVLPAARIDPALLQRMNACYFDYAAHRTSPTGFAHAAGG